MEEYKFESIYQFINIVYKSVKNEVELWGYDKEEFINYIFMQNAHYFIITWNISRKMEIV